jgi:hypothetical protein
MNTLTTADSKARKTRSIDTRPRDITRTLIDPIGCENQFDLKDAMTRSEALIIAFRILWCQKIGPTKRRLKPNDLLDIVAAINRLKPEPRQSPVTIASLLKKVRVFLGDEYMKEAERLFEKPIAFEASQPVQTAAR